VPSLHACRSTLEDPLDAKIAIEILSFGSVIIHGKISESFWLILIIEEGKKCQLKNVKIEKLIINGTKYGTELEFVIMVIAVSCVKLLSAHNSTQHTSRKHKV
jgi:hypothetical protein